MNELWSPLVFWEKKASLGYIQRFQQLWWDFIAQALNSTVKQWTKDLMKEVEFNEWDS